MITVTAENLRDIQTQIGFIDAPITIRWRGVDWNDLRTGCIVSFYGDEVPHPFDDRGQALAYIAEILKKHDQDIEEEKLRRRGSV